MKNQNFEETAYTLEEAAALFQDRIKNTFTDYLGLELLEYKTGYCYTRLNVKPEFINPNGSLHGGLLYTVADTTAGVASSRLGISSTVTTVTGDMQFLRPALNLNQIFAKAEVIKDGKRMVFTDVQILSEEGTLLAKGSFTFARLVLPGVKAPE